METQALSVFLVAAALVLAVQGRNYRASHLSNQRDTEHIDDIPQSCLEHSVTPVLCANATTRDALLPHPDDCRLFYYCVSATAAAVCRECNANLHFNPRLYVCDAPERAGCEGDGSDEWAPEGEAGPGRCATVAATPASCADAASDGLMAHPDDCGLYYQCVSATAAPQCRPCNAGLHFNPLLRVCDLPDRAGCVAA